MIPPLALSLALGLAAHAAGLSADEELLILPGYAVESADGRQWQGRLRAWAFEPEPDGAGRNALLKALAKALGLAAGAAEEPAFRERARLFLADNERRKDLKARAAGLELSLGRTGADGHVEAVVRLPAESVRAGWLEVEGDAPRGSRRLGRLQLLAREGALVISDIDDTVKVSLVRDRAALLANTFLKPFAPVEGMSRRYSGWAAGGAAFHYVSASPWQLFPALDAFLREQGFPEGSFDMKKFRWKSRSFFSLFGGQDGYKRSAILPLLEALPGRRFYLVGDSGEQDPEIFGALARDFPDRVASVFIRDVTGEGRSGPRYLRAFAGLPRERWRVFADPSELPERLP